MIAERYWSITGSLDRRKFEELLQQNESGDMVLVTIDVTGTVSELPVVVIGDGSYDGKSIQVHFTTSPGDT